MKHGTCEQCGKTAPLNGLYRVFERLLCEECGNQELSQHPRQEISEGSIVQQVDPTICVQCQRDNGNNEWSRLAGAPICDECEHFFRHRPYPTWLKAAFVGLIGLAILSLIRNERFFVGYLENVRAERALKKGDMEKASDLLDAAARHVPESEPLGDKARFVRALVLLSQDKSSEAVPLLQECKRRLPQEPSLNQLLLIAESGAAFDQKDYETFLAKCQALLALAPHEPRAVAGVGSAYACKYAVTGKEEFKKESLRHLEMARREAGANNAELAEYEGRIRHRLATQEILSRKEYQARFPQGWHAEAKP